MPNNDTDDDVYMHSNDNDKDGDIEMNVTDDNPLVVTGNGENTATSVVGTTLSLRLNDDETLSQTLQNLFPMGSKY